MVQTEMRHKALSKQYNNTVIIILIIMIIIETSKQEGKKSTFRGHLNAIIKTNFKVTNDAETSTFHPLIYLFVSLNHC